MKNKIAATSSAALLGWLCLIVISVGSIIRGCSYWKISSVASGISRSAVNCIQNISSAAENITGCILDLTDTIFHFLYYNYCDFVLGLF
ncbi:MAG: hypothetical protein K2H84_05255 [Paramuribaculum sp.]|nr:hypothetical protein [Paramuribaculum sp.]